MQLALSDTFTKYHGRREKIAVVSVPGKQPVTLGLSDTQRCATSLDMAKLTVKNVAGDVLPVGAIDTEAQRLHEHCRVLSGIHEDAK